MKNAEIIQIKTINGKLYATISFQDENHIGDINNGYNHYDIPINTRPLQESVHGNVLVDQSLKSIDIASVSK